MFYIWLLIACATKNPVSVNQQTGLPTIIQNQSIDEIAQAKDPIVIPPENLAKIRKQMWKKHVAEQQENSLRQKERKKNKLWIENTTMKYSLKANGEKPPNGYPLYIALHGGGGGPGVMNDMQWRAMKSYYNGSIPRGIYVAPRGITNTWNLHFVGQSYPFYDKLIDNLILSGEVNPNRVYLLGFSAGGDGVYQITPRMAERLAGANMSAGHPNGTPAINLYQVPFLIQMGENDRAYNRNRAAVQYFVQLQNLKQKNPEGYSHDLFLHKNGTHNSPWRDNNTSIVKYPIIKHPGKWLKKRKGNRQAIKRDANAVRWLLKHRRDPHPKQLIWQPTTRANSRGERAMYHYWLHVDPDNKNTRIEALVENNTVTITEAQDDLSILIDPILVDVTQPITIKKQDQVLYTGEIVIDLRHLAKSIKMRNDPHTIYVNTIAVDIP